MFRVWDALVFSNVTKVNGAAYAEKLSITYL